MTLGMDFPHNARENSAAGPGLKGVFRRWMVAPFNSVTSSITYPVDNPTGPRCKLVDTLTPSSSPQDYIDTQNRAATWSRVYPNPVYANIKPARYTKVRRVPRYGVDYGDRSSRSLELSGIRLLRSDR